MTTPPPSEPPRDPEPAPELESPRGTSHETGPTPVPGPPPEPSATAGPGVPGATPPPSVPPSTSPGAPPPGGYAVPPGMANWVTPPSAVTSAPTNDPLVPYDFSSLFDRIVGIVKRSWRSLLAIQAVGTLVPTAVVLTVVAITGLGSLTVLGPTGTATTAPLSEEEIRRLLATLAGAGVALLLLALVASYVAAAASAASIWTVTRQAAGQPAPFGEAFRYGFRRALSLFGWNLLSGLCIAVGLLCCILPGVYLGVALSLIAPIVVFEGGNAFSRSFRLVHSDFWPVAGRVVLVYLAYLAFSFIVDVPNTIVSMVPMEPSAKVVVGLVVQLITAALTVPGAIALLVGLTMVYTEVRARQEHLSTPQLVTELDHA